MFSRSIFTKFFLALIGLTAGSHVNAQAPANSKPADPMHCALTLYIPWVRAQGRPLDPDLKAKKLQEIDIGSLDRISFFAAVADATAEAAVGASGQFKYFVNKVCQVAGASKFGSIVASPGLAVKAWMPCSTIYSG